MGDFEEYGEDFYLYHEVGPCNFKPYLPKYNASKVFALDISENPQKKDVIAIKPLINKLLQDYAELGFDVDGCPHILFFRKIMDEAEQKEMNINQYIDELDIKTRDLINEFDKHLGIIEKIDKKYRISEMKHEINETEDENGVFDSTVTYGMTNEQREQHGLIYSFTVFYECMVYDIIAFLYKKIARLRALWHSNGRKSYLIQIWEEEEKNMKEYTPFKDWKKWYNFLRKKYYEVYYVQLEGDENRSEEE